VYCLAVSRDGTIYSGSEAEGLHVSWRAPRPGFEPASEISTLTALLGLDPAKPLLVGLLNGEIIKL